MEQTKKATRDYMALSRTPWSLWETMYARRSHRKYLPCEPDASFVDALQEAMLLAADVRDARQDGIIAVGDERALEEFKRRAHKGAPNKINLWLTRAPVLGFLALTVPAEDMRQDRPRELPRVVMAAQDVVLWLTERGLGTCWVGGIDQGEVRQVLGLDAETAVPAAITFGKPKPRVRARDYDGLAYLALSRHRKPLPAIACRQNVNEPFVPGNLRERSFSAAPAQRIGDLLRDLSQRKESIGDAPLELALEACLEAARIAPSAANAQRWCFVAVTAEEKLAELAAACGGGQSWRAAVVGMGRPGGWEAALFERPLWMLDLPIAFSHLSLMAASLGLAVDLYLDGFAEERVSETTNNTGKFRVAGLMGIR